MSDSDGGPTPPDDLPERLIQRVDALDLSELTSLRSYIEQRIESPQVSLTADIEANAAGEVLNIEIHGGHAHVETHPPDSNGSGVDTEITSLYHVQREPHPDGTKSLHWAYLGDVYNTPEARCETCGRTFDHEVDVCPNCGSEDVDHPETEE